MKKSKLIITIVVSVILLFFTAIIFSSDVISYGPEVDLSTYDQSEDSVSIRNLHINAEVGKNNVVTITEKFEVKFNALGLTEVVRFVPYASYVYRETENGVQKTIHYSRISDISGTGENGEELNVYIDEEDGFMTIGLKSSKKVPVFDVRSYEITYTMDMGRDRNSGFDDVYFNIVGTNSLLTIENITFDVSLPSDVSETKSVNVYTGAAGSTKTLEYTSSGEVVIGSVDKLGPGEGITLRAVYEDGFLTYDIYLYMSQIISVVAAFAGVILALIVLLKLRQSMKYPRPVEVSVPEGVTPFIADAYINGSCSEKSVSASIISLANMGFVKIKEHENKTIELIKVKDANKKLDNGLTSLLNAIFTGGKETVMLSDLSVDFLSSANAIKLAEKNKCISQLYDKKKRKQRNGLIYALAFIMVAVTVGMFAVSYDYLGFFSEIFTIYSILMGAVTIIGILLMLSGRNYFIPKCILPAVMLVYALLLYIKVGYSQIDELWLAFISYLIISFIPLLSHGDAIYSKEGETIKGRIEGFKDFIKKCEVSQIKMFVEENPTYYFDVLPYAYVFGLSDVWMEKFKSLEMQMPEWVETENSSLMDILIFNAMFNSFMRNSHDNFLKARAAMIKTSSSSFGGGFGGGSFGGGGFSGGGAGGGGFGAR